MYAYISMIIKNVPTTSATIKKVWNDENNKAGKRPESLTVKLSAGTEVTLNVENKWTATVDGLPKYDEKGKEIEYTWTEGEMPEGYSLESTKAEGTVTTITNKFTPPEEPPTPDEPSNPDEPSKPSMPGTPAKPSKPAKPRLPQTGDLSGAAPALLLGAGIASLAAAARRKRAL